MNILRKNIVASEFQGSSLLATVAQVPGNMTYKKKAIVDIAVINVHHSGDGEVS